MATEPIPDETIDEFIARTGVTMTVESIPQRSDRNNDWDREASHWLVTISRDGRSMSVEYSMGSAHTGEPELRDVLDNLASDSAGYENASGFEDWAADYGYDTDSRRAYATFEAVAAQRSQLASLFDDDDFDRLLWHTERE